MGNEPSNTHTPFKYVKEYRGHDRLVFSGNLAGFIANPNSHGYHLFGLGWDRSLGEVCDVRRLFWGYRQLVPQGLSGYYRHDYHKLGFNPLKLVIPPRQVS